MDSTKIESELGWRAQIDFKEGLGETVRWYESHPDWVATIRTGEYREYYKKQYGRKLNTDNSVLKTKNINVKHVNTRSSKTKSARIDLKKQKRTRTFRPVLSKKASKRR
jgi:hypothetical protein